MQRRTRKNQTTVPAINRYSIKEFLKLFYAQDIIKQLSLKTQSELYFFLARYLAEVYDCAYSLGYQDGLRRYEADDS